MRSAFFVLAGMVAFAAPAHAVTYRCPPAPAAFSNGQALPDGWQIAIEETPKAQIDAWADGIAFFLPPVSGQAGVTELQCVARVQIDIGKLATVEARKALDGRARCSFSKRNQSFECDK
jgi:hypothetical protein